MNTVKYWSDPNPNLARRLNGTHPIVLMTFGRKFWHALIMNDMGVDALKIPANADLDDVLFHGKPYPRRRALKMFRDRARRVGITERAKRLLRGAS